MATWANSFGIKDGAWGVFTANTIRQVRCWHGSETESSQKNKRHDYAGLRISISSVYVPIVYIWVVGFVAFYIRMFQPVDISVAGSKAANKVVLKSNHAT